MGILWPAATTPNRNLMLAVNSITAAAPTTTRTTTTTTTTATTNGL